MLSDTHLRSQVDALWEKLWSGGLSNPLDAIEQLSYLLFLKQLDEREQDAERAARLRGKAFEPLFPDTNDGRKLRWSYWSQLPANEALPLVRDQVFPFLRNLGDRAGSFGEHMANAEFKINKPSLLIEACRSIEALNVSSQNQDVQGDLYEYLLGRLNTAGTNGQFRTPRHIIRMMVKMVDPKPGERVCDPAAGTCGFLVNAWQHILETHTDPQDLTFDDEGWPHGLTGVRLPPDGWEFAQERGFTGYDSDSGMTMLRLGSMNMILHGLESPSFHYTDTLSKAFTEESLYDIVLANPPFKGAIDASDVNPTLPTKVRKTEILFLHLFLRLLENGGRAAVIVPSGVLFGTPNAYVSIRKRLVEENRLEAVISMPSGVFRPYTGVSTAVLIFTKAAATEHIWFYDMEHDGFSLDDRRQRVSESDIPDVLECWRKRNDSQFQVERSERLQDLQKQIEPLKVERLHHLAGVHRLRFEEVVADDVAVARQMRETAERELGDLERRLQPLTDEINRLNRQFWVAKEQVVSNGYDLSATTYRGFEQPAPFHEAPPATLERLQRLSKTTDETIVELRELVDHFAVTLASGPALRLGDVVKITGGGTPSRKNPGYFKGSIPWLTSKDMRGDYIWDTEEHVTEVGVASSATKVVPAGSILVVVKSKVLMHRLPLAIAMVPLCHGQDIKSIQCLDGFEPEFVRFVLKYHEARLLNAARGANTEGLTLPMLEELPVPNVDYSDQKQFSDFVAKYERLRSAQREGLRLADHLCDALLDRAF